MFIAAGLQWGDVPTWFGSVGTVLAFAIALLIYAQSLGDRRRDQAGRITAWVHGNPTILDAGQRAENEEDYEPVEGSWTKNDKRILIEISIRNASDQIISDVSATLVPLDRANWDVAEMRWLDLGPGEEQIKAIYKYMDDRAGRVRVRIEFTDTQGRQWIRLGGNLRRSHKPAQVSISQNIKNYQVCGSGEMPLLVRSDTLSPSGS
jgi:hypothetical protein